MTDGCYDMDGRCVNCGKLHPCRCEALRPCEHCGKPSDALFCSYGCKDADDAKHAQNEAESEYERVLESTFWGREDTTTDDGGEEDE